MNVNRFPFPVTAAVPLYLAPMAGVSESPFRRLCRRFGADVVVTEFLSAEGIRRENEATLYFQGRVARATMEGEVLRGVGKRQTRHTWRAVRL